MKKKKRFGFNNFLFALRGMLLFLRSEPSAHIHTAIFLVACFLGFLLHVSPLEWCVIILAGGIVLLAEALNTALEVLADEVSEEWSERIGEAKDLAAGAVLLAGIAGFSVGVIIFLPKIFTFFTVSH